ncbi:hypothetical protein NVS89_22715 [Ancylobacter sp. MQZ15Z-1]|uniref:Uncharacterized protein n=1 Tax=Ancylobacter mangrovi TaxID=2972472 RepID=A0A9X2PQC1_9HYPH|nr:hypothetical protein [Ancylobacter mangrovi]MCS0497908.1 hypothetical protein [Ancylobacter mangrovi]
MNRYLADKAMDDIDHALGRPLDPMGETYRNRFATSGAKAEEMASSPHWEEFERAATMRFFGVTAEGRKALADHLRAIGDRYRAFVVSFEGYEDVVAAPSPAEARYKRWLSISDSWSELTFGEFLRGSRVRRAA